MKILKENQEENNYWHACKNARNVYKMMMTVTCVELQLNPVISNPLGNEN